MPKSKGKGGKNRRRGKNEADVEKRELEFKEDGQDYAKVTRMLGNGRLEAICADGQKRLCHIRGKMRKKVWISVGDIILVGLRDFQDKKADVILKVGCGATRGGGGERERVDCLSLALSSSHFFFSLPSLHTRSTSPTKRPSSRRTASSRRPSARWRARLAATAMRTTWSLTLTSKVTWLAFKMAID